MADKKVPALCGLKSVPELTNPVIISDVHLAANKPKTIMAFLRFMKNVAPRFAGWKFECTSASYHTVYP